MGSNDIVYLCFMEKEKKEMTSSKAVALTSYVCFIMEVESVEGEKFTFLKKKKKWWIINDKQEMKPFNVMADQLHQLYLAFIFDHACEIMIGDYNVKLYGRNDDKAVDRVEEE